MRVTNRLIAVVLSAALIVAGAVTAVEVAAARTANRSRPLLVRYDRVATVLRDHSWQDRSVRLVCAGLVLAGLLLAAAGLWRGPRYIPLSTEDSGLLVVTDRATVRRVLERAAATAEGVYGTRAWVFRRRIWVTIQVRPRPRPAAEIEAEVTGVLKVAMDRIGLVDRPRVLLRLREKR